jgi:hypothetical protein
MVFEILIGIGLIFVAAGLGGLFWCIAKARKAQSGGLSEEEMRGLLTKLSAVNMASMGGATFGLAMVLAGLILP